MHQRFGPPIDLSDLPNYQRSDYRPRRPVFVGRVSTKDNQNPASSIPRQVVTAGERLEDGEEFAAYFWDVESGMLPPELRGLGSQEMYDALGVPTRRDGGLQELVDRAEQLGVTHVLAERSDRLSRAMLTSLTVEHALEKLGVEVIYANEPVGGTESGRLRTRRYGQVDAEIYRATMLEMSMGGQIQHAIAGWNHGYAPYPYITQVDEAAPARPDRFGVARPKQQLVPHPDARRFDAARELCRLRREERLKGPDIVAILNADHDRYPPLGQRWTYNMVEGLIANPKLSGYMVYNRRRARTGKAGHSRWNPVSEWAWSPEPVHQAVISIEQWRQAQEITAGLRTGADASGPLTRLRAAARRQGLTVAALRANDSFTLYRIGNRQIVLPTPLPDTLAQQVIDDLEAAL